MKTTLIQNKEAYFIRMIEDREMYLHFESKYSIFSKKYFEKGSYVFKRFKEGACIFDLKNAENIVNLDKENVEMVSVKEALNL